MQDYADVWRAADKIVFSTTLQSALSARTRIERDLSIGGPALAAHAIRAGLVDEYHLFLSPVVVGGGNQFLPEAVRLDLELLDERRFGNGVAHLHYRTRT